MPHDQASNAKPSTKSALPKKGDDPSKRDRHGPNRGLPPPPTFDLDELADGTLLSELETAAVLRNSTHTLASWRLRKDRRRDHRLAWIVLPNKQIRYRVRDIRAYLALGEPKPKSKPKSKPQDPPPPPSRGRSARPNKSKPPGIITTEAMTEHAQGAARRGAGDD